MDKNKLKIFFNSLASDVKENVTEGAKVLSNLSKELLEDVKVKAEELYESGSEKFEQASAVVHNYVDTHKNDKEIKELSKHKTELNGKLGDIIYHEFKKNGTVTKRFMTTKKVSKIMENIETIDKQIIKKGKEIDDREKKNG